MATSNRQASNILFIHTSDLRILRGSERWLIEVCNRLRDENKDVIIDCFPSQLKKYVTNTVEVEARTKRVYSSFRGVPIKTRKWIALRLPFNGRIARVMNRNLQFVPLSFGFVRDLIKADTIYFVSTSDNPARLLSILTISLLTGKRRMFVGMHVSMIIPKQHLMLLRLFSRFGALTAIHAVNSKDALAYGNELKCRSVYIPNGVDCQKFRPGTKSETFTVLFVGALGFDKGADLLPEIYEALTKHASTETIKFFIASPGGDFKESIQKWSRNREAVIMKGFVTEDELASLYREASVVLLPSRVEPFGLVALEAQASGTPVIASSATGFRSTILNGETGYLVRSYDASHFAKQAYEIFQIWKSSRSIYSEMCAKARTHAESEFSWDPIIASLQRLLEIA